MLIIEMFLIFSLCLNVPSLNFRSSRHSSTSSLADKSAAALAEAAINLDLRLSGVATSGEKVETPAPFPLTSQIGTGGLSRQGSLRKSGGETPSGSSPTSERKSVPGSPTTPTGCRCYETFFLRRHRRGGKIS